MNQKATGFTLIELLIFMAIFSVAALSFLGILISITNIQVHQQSQNEVSGQSQFVLQQLQYYIQNARLIDMTADSATGTLKLREFSAALDPTIITIATGTVYIQQGGGSLQPLTNSQVVVSSSSFTRHFNFASSSAFGVDSVSFSFTVARNTSNTKQAYSQTYQSAVAVLAPVPKIALTQQAKAEGNSASVSTLAATYGANNATGTLLIATTGNATSSASVSIADSAGNTWTKVGSITYGAYNEEMNVFTALNAKNSSNTVTATFGAGAGYASLFVYEYRGAATASSLDASSTQLQPGTKTPSSGSTNPTSTVELLFGATYNGSTAEIPAAGSGFTLETTSTVSSVFAEDEDQYITGPVAATWQYTSTTPSSSVLLVTFK